MRPMSLPVSLLRHPVLSLAREILQSTGPETRSNSRLITAREKRSWQGLRRVTLPNPRRSTDVGYQSHVPNLRQLHPMERRIDVPTAVPPAYLSG